MAAVTVAIEATAAKAAEHTMPEVLVLAMTTTTIFKSACHKRVYRV